MIKINIIKHDGLVDNITIKGHANYEEHGKDIVCAAVSSIAITTINGIIRLDSNSVSYEEKEGLIDIKILIHNDVVDTLISNMIGLLEDLEEKYSKNIKIIK